MIHPLTLLKGAGLGAGIMYFFDPISGTRRRAMVQDQLKELENAFSATNRQAGVAYREVSHRLQDAKAELESVMEDSKNQGIVERVQEGAKGVGSALGMQGENWSPTAKAAAALAGAGLVASLMNKRDLAALALGAVGLTFVAKEIADQEAHRSEGQGPNRTSQQPKSGSKKKSVASSS